MKLSVSVWIVYRKNSKGFTLVEVLVAVMIISVVIMALLEMQGNTTHIFSRLKNNTKTQQYTSFFISNDKYGFDKDSIYLDDLLKDFRMEDDLRRELKEIKVELTYKKLDDFSDMTDKEDNSTTGSALEIGETTFKINDVSTSLLRLHIR